MPLVKIGEKTARAMFHPCDVDYIREVCNGRCCRSSDGSTHISVTPDQEAGLEKYGVTINGNHQIDAKDRCPLQSEEGLCKIHFTADMPRGCIFSPFRIHPTADTLIIKWRNRSLICYKTKEGKQPAYKAHNFSLVTLFGAEEAARITKHFDVGGGDIIADMLPERYEDMRGVGNILSKRFDEQKPKQTRLGE